MFRCGAIRLSHKTIPQRNSMTKGNSVSPAPLYNPKGVIYVPFFLGIIFFCEYRTVMCRPA
jgi:hypothetical protein